MDIDEWAEHVDRFVAGGQEDKTVTAAALTGWLGTPITDYTEGMWEAVCRRTSWLFPDGWVFNVGTGFMPSLTHLTDKLDKDTTFPMPDFFNKEGWSFQPHINGWCWEEAEGTILNATTLANLVDTFTVILGEPKIVLPWYYSFGESLYEQGEEHYEMFADDYENVNPHQKFFEMMEILKPIIDNGGEGLPWEVIFDSETSGLSKHSDFNKFLLLVEKIEEGNIMIVDLDQHCAGCSSGVTEWAVKNNPALEGKPVFRTWGQNSQMSWLGDGTVWLEDVYVDDSAVEKRIKFLAEEVGIHTGIYEDDWEPSGEFSMVSPGSTSA